MVDVKGKTKPVSGRIVNQKQKIILRRKLENPALKKLALAFAIVVLALGLYVTYLAPHTLEVRQRIELESTQNRLIQTQRQLQSTQAKNAAEAAQKQKQLEETQKQLEETNRQLQAKREANTALAVNVPTASARPSVQAAPRVTVSGTCAEWIAGAGIGDVANAQELLRRESGCNPNAINPSSGACGVAQELPCGKSGCSLGDGACQMRWMNSYVLGRYGSWANAIAWHNAHNWY